MAKKKNIKKKVKNTKLDPELVKDIRREERKNRYLNARYWNDYGPWYE